MNVIEAWLKLIGTPERARKLRARVDSLASPEQLDPDFGPEPAQCPTTVLFGAKTSQRLYADPEFRPALDAWDMGHVTRGDIRRWCLEIEKGRYREIIDPYQPVSSPSVLVVQEGILATV